MASIMKKASFCARFTEGGILKMISRAVLTISIIVALVFAGIGLSDILSTREADEAAATAKKITTAQEKEYKALQKAAEKDGTEMTVSDPSEIEVEVEPVVYNLGDYFGAYFGGYLIWSLVSIAAGVALSIFISRLNEIAAALKKAGPRRVIAGFCFWVGTIVAAVFAVLGIVHVLLINKSTLPAIGEILMKEYLVWAVLAFGVGLALHWLILNLGRTKDSAFTSVGLKLTKIGKAIFTLAVALFPFAVIASIVAWILTGWLNGVIGLVSACALLAAGWIAGLALNALGTCTMIMEPQAQEAMDREAAHRTAKDWVCPDCGKVHPIYVAQCEDCGTAKPSKRRR